MNLFRPAIYQGGGKKDRYFEGWYFKNVAADEKAAVAVIPGISLSGDSSHSFVQFFDARNNKAYYFRYGVNDFWADKKEFQVKIGRNYFSQNRLQLDIEGAARIRADLSFRNISGWPVSLFSPGVMGWYAYMPFMECYHGVLSFDHAIEGYIEINGEKKDFTGGKGYCEKDWGASMPSSWIWMQSNHFDRQRLSLFASVATIPWLGSRFTGYIIGLFADGKVHKFTTYNGAKITGLKATPSHLEFTVKKGSLELSVTGERKEGAFLPAPKMGEMSSKVMESLDSVLSVRLTDKGRVLIDGKGRNAGLEFVGDIEELIANL